MNIEKYFNLLEEHFERSISKPYCIVYSTITIDGKTAFNQISKSQLFSDFIPDKLFNLFFKFRNICDGIMVGSNTIIIDNPILESGINSPENKYSIIPDSNLKIPIKSRIFNSSKKIIIAVTSKSPKKGIKILQKKGIKVLMCGDGLHVDLSILMAKLKEMGLRSLLIEGGGTLISHLLKKNLIEELWVIKIPIIIGGRNTPSLVEIRKTNDFSQIKSFKLEIVKKLDDCIISCYLIQND